MLLAVEGGRFFSSSASGYSNGLNLLLLGHKKEEKPMRVTPWNQYHLVDQEPDPVQLAANNKNRCACGCASFTCFGGGLDVGPTQHQQPVVKNSNSSHLEEISRASYDGGDHDNLPNGRNVNSLRSSLKKRATAVAVSVADNEPEPEVELAYQSARRSVHWTDVRGGELCEIREFEPSEHSDSDDEFENGIAKTCSCRIM